MSDLLTKKPFRNVNGILDYLGDKVQQNQDFVDNYENMAADRSYLTNKPSVEIEILINCCSISMDLLNTTQKITTLIDIGCGFGHVLNNITLPECTVGVDISLNRLNNLRKDVIKVRAFAETLPFFSNHFDVAICTDIFEHVQDEKLLVKELYRILKPGGFVLFSCPWEQDLSVYDLKEYKEKFVDYKYKHLRTVNHKMIQECFSEFDIISSTDIVSHMRAMIFEPYRIKFFIFRKK